MANEVQVFNFEQMNVRTVEIDDEVWFVAVDVAKALEIKNVSDALKRLDDDERGRFNLGRQGETNVISEAGLYRFIGGSRKKEAKQFMRWVNHEVLPSIRKTGGYQAQLALRLPENNAEMVQVIQNVNKETNRRIDEVETTVDELKDRFGLPASQAKSLEQARKRHIVTLLGGFESNAYQHLSGKTFRQIGGDFKDYFEVPRYDALPLSKFDEGMSYIKAWQLPTNLALQVRDLNLQTELEV
ncbi:hypothetical protein G9403_06480 [Weissella paramesenteroides]|uniref:Bro-N domain-containing protein n=1 Tax=Weissella paramesenteroides TaxID=1249 RepID=A0ABD4XJ18_WEIPA|nr:ORF6C domain-containing protein [Weissella paramesenteroides]MDF8369276.1 hypothetical protein [Weissella paramesenteroides]MDF8371289.1 hypothetical protein [Weissella paramesenteroides]